MKVFTIILAVIYCFCIVFNQVTFHATENRLGWPEVVFRRKRQKWEYNLSVAVTYLISICGWVIQMIYLGYGKQDIVHPLSWCMFISGLIIVLLDLLEVAAHYDHVRGSGLGFMNLGVAFIAIFGKAMLL